MPKSIRSADEVQEVKDAILAAAIDLIGEKGFSSLSMRKLASALDMTAANIYNYYRNKDELYLDIQTRGFEKLYENFLAVASSKLDSREKLKSLAFEYLRFGREHPHWYNIIFSMDTPKYADYRESPLAETAYREKQAGLKLITLTAALLEKELQGSLKREELSRRIIRVWVTLHGIVSLANSRVLQEVEEDFSFLMDGLAEEILDN